MDPLVANISDTARWVAVFRADETERADAVFKDPFARRLAGEKGQQIASALGFSTENRWSFVARTYLFDQVVMEHVKDGYDLVLNLAAGLDTRAYRLPLPNTLQWVEVDLPGILDYKEKVLAGEKPVCQLESIRLDLSDRPRRNEMLAQISSRAEKILVITEGLIIYLNDNEAAALASDLADQPGIRHWAFDLASPPLLSMIQMEMGSKFKESNITFKFAPEEGEDFFKPFGWKSLASYSFMQAAAKLNRLPAHMVPYAAMPEPPGPRRPFPWSGVCLFENVKS